MNLPMQEMQVRFLGWEDPQEKEWQPTSVFLPGKSHGQRSLGGPLGHKELDTTGTPLQYSCLENPMDGGAWQAAVHGVARVGHD